ncbi:hypothetical protein [Paucibacter sp. XJ19-41]|uniref:hypothetical protein n=1 Tax=Paucibacter sp. XJ19-41 TaxID=2927824 RepID=UPI00234A9B35|nr:hypothetical protein [Paucibacter sp. XJ19-41]MDC6170804.1 hypothetical protein [Paucibacter sp. XJ19-41]
MTVVRSIFISMAALSLAVGSAHAGWADNQEQRVDQRQERQTGRIAAGIESGQLTRREQLRLEHQQARTARLEQRVEADGRVTGKEALRLEQRQDRNSRSIKRARHDGQTRP